MYPGVNFYLVASVLTHKTAILYSSFCGGFGMAFMLAIGLALCLRRCERRGCKQENPVYLIGRLTSNLGGVKNRKLTRLPGHHCGGRAIILFGRFLLRFEPLGCQFSAFHLFVSTFFDKVQ